MLKRLLLTVILLTSFFGGGILTISAENTAKAIWCADNKTLYFLYDNVTYSTGSSGNNTYDGHPITNYWEGTRVTEAYGSGRYYTESSVINNCKYVVVKDNFSSSGLTNCWGMFKGFKVLESVVGLNNMITSSVTTTACMFEGCSSLGTISFSGVNTSNVQYMDNMFDGCSALVSTASAPLDLSSFNTSKVKQMSAMFQNCSTLTTLDLSCFNSGDSSTGEVTTMRDMFSGCSALVSLNLTGFITSKVTNMWNMFKNCQALTSLDLSSFNTSNVTTMCSMFDKCESLTSLNVTSFNTSEVTDMSYMFKGCKALTSIDVSSFDVSKVTTMYEMFNMDDTNSALVTIYAYKNWLTEATSLTSGESIFNNCLNLVGAISYKTNTSADSHGINYANPTTGYFTKTGQVVMSFDLGPYSTGQRATVGTDYPEPPLTIWTSGITVTYSSSNTAVATVDPTTGEVTPISSGTTTITAAFAGNEHYAAKSVSYDLTVDPITFNASIGGVVLTSDHINVSGKLTTDIGTKLTSGSVALTANADYSGLTLTLTNARIEMTENIIPFSNSGTLSLVLVGNNVISSTNVNVYNNTAGTLTISGAGTLTLSGSQDGSIENKGSITMTGGTLNASGSKFGYYGSDAASNLTINDGVLMATGGTASIRVNGSLTLGSGEAITQPIGAEMGGTGIWDVHDAAGHSITSQVTIAKGATACGLAYSAATGSATYGTTPTALPTLSNPHSLPVTYTSSTTSVATVAANGTVTIVHPGTTTITATFDGSATYLGGTASYTLTVQKATPVLTFSEATATATYGAAYTGPTLTVIPEGLISDVYYYSNEQSVAKIVDNNVVIQGKGTAEISARLYLGDSNEYYNGVQTTYTLTVSPATATLAFANSSLEGKVGKAVNSPTVTTTPASLTVKYSSSDETRAIVNETTGVVTPLREGTVTITAKVDDGHYYGTTSYQLTISKNAHDLAFDKSEAGAAYGSDFTPPTLSNPHSLVVFYGSSDHSVATVNAEGAVTLVGVGETDITAQTYGNETYSAGIISYHLKVVAAIATLTLAETSVEGKMGTTINSPAVTTTPASLTVKYSSSDETVATVDENTGVVTPLKEGTVTITAKVDDGYYYGTTSYELTISKNANGLAFSEATATATYNTSFTPPTLTNPNSLSVTYESSEPTVATVADDGTVTLLKAGETTISAKFDGNNVYEAGTVSYELTVNKGTPTLTFEKAEVDAKVGVDFTPSLTVSPEGLTVVYSSSDTDLAAVDAATGKVTPKAEGEVTITATVNDSKYEGSASYKMTITKNANGLAFSDPTESVAYDTNFTPPTLANPNNLAVTYESSEPTVATIDSDGKVTVLKVGETTISAKFAGNVAYEAGTVNYVLTVDPKTVSTPTITLSETSFTYDGNAKTPTVTVKDGEKVIPAEEYTVGYQDNTNVGTATVTITDKEGGNYVVSGSATFSIASADGSLVPPVGLSGLTYSGAAQDLITAGSSTTGTMQYSLDGTTYIETIPQGTDAQEYTVYYKVVAKAGYKDVDPASFKVTIAPKIVSSPTITLSQTSYEYDGTAKEPTVTVKDGTTTIDAEEYTVSYKNNTEAGTATVVITDKEGGNYNVSGSITFEITAKDEPSTDEPSTDEPSTDEPSTDEPSTDEPSTDEPSTDEPSIDEPTPDNVTITISGAKQVPYFCEYNLDFTDKPELKAYVATGYDKAKGTIWLTRVKQVPAETGFLLMGEPGDYDIPTIDGVSDVYYKNMFKGTLTGTTIQTTDGEYTNYYLSKGTSGVGFYKVTNADGQSISANRCYLPILTDIPANGSEGDAEVIKVSAAKQVPYYTSKNIDFSSLEAQGVKAYTATGYNYKTGIIWLTRVKKVPAQTGILVMADKEGEYSVPTTSVQSVYENMFTGSETAQTIYTTETVGDITYINYYLSNGTSGIGFYKVTKEDGVKMGANRSYLQIPKREKASGARAMEGHASFCKMIISDNDDDVIAIPVYGEGTTGIIESGITNPLQQEVVWYTLQGLRVDKPGKGLYIRNGKTVLIK